MTNPKPCPDEPPGPITPTRFGWFGTGPTTPDGGNPPPPPKPHVPFSWFGTSPCPDEPPGPITPDRLRELVDA